jgi:hypothetical protein
MLSPIEKSQIRLYLGYPDLFRYKDTRLESTLDALSDEAETLVRGALASLVIVEALLLKNLSTAGLKRVDDVWFDAAGAMLTQQRKAGRTYVSRISITLGVNIYSDVFGTQGYLGDSFAGFANQSGGGFFNLG